MKNMAGVAGMNERPKHVNLSGYRDPGGVSLAQEAFPDVHLNDDLRHCSSLFAIPSGYIASNMMSTRALGLGAALRKAAFSPNVGMSRPMWRVAGYVLMLAVSALRCSP